MIRVTYSSVDGVRTNRTFKTVAAAREFAIERVGKNPEFGSTYAVSSDGIGKVEVSGVSLRGLFEDPNDPNEE